MRTAALSIALSLFCAATAVAAVPSGNLLTNPGAEASTSAPPLPGWTTSGAFDLQPYGQGGIPDTEISGRYKGGCNLFTGGYGSGPSSATQVVDVSQAAQEIDAGSVTARLSGRLGGWGDQDDSATLSATAVNATGGALGTFQIGPVTAAQRGNVTDLLARSATATVPAGTRTFTVAVVARHAAGAWNDGYADNLGLTLDGTTPPAPPEAFSCAAFGPVPAIRIDAPRAKRVYRNPVRRFKGDIDFSLRRVQLTIVRQFTIVKKRGRKRKRLTRCQRFNGRSFGRTSCSTTHAFDVPADSFAWDYRLPGGRALPKGRYRVTVYAPAPRERVAKATVRFRVK